jgi:uncharacterized protein YjbI with pentapeptide repeats
VSNDLENRWEETRAIHSKYKNFYKVLQGVFIVSIFALIGWNIFSSKEIEYGMNVFTELVGIVGTYFVFDRVSHWVSEKERKESLIFQLSSPSSLFAIEAVRTLRYQGWLEDGTLSKRVLAGSSFQGADLTGAVFEESVATLSNFSECKLSGVNFQNAQLLQCVFRKSSLTMRILTEKGQPAFYQICKLDKANLSGADFTEAVIDSASLAQAILTNAKFTSARLSNSYFGGAYLEKANFVDAQVRKCDFSLGFLAGADFSGSDLRGSSFAGAIFKSDVWEAKFSENTTLPDGTKWYPEIDMTKFVQPSTNQ